SGAIAHDAGDLPSSGDSIQHPACIAEQGLILSDREFEKIIGADVVPDIKVRGAAKLIHIENVLYRGSLLPCTGLRRRAIVDRVGQGVVEVKADSIAKTAPQRERHAMESRLAGIHPCRH